MMTKESAPPIRLLLVDDEVEFTSIMLKRLGRRNIVATTANSGSQAIALMSRNAYDVAVLDLKMEGMDGLDVLKAFKQMSPDMPVIMLTGHGSHMAAEEGFAHGAFAYLSKPYDIEGLTQIIRRAVSGERGSA